MAVEFTAHNIRLDDGTYTKPDMGYSMESYPWFVSARRVLETVFPGNKQHLRLADLGSLEGGYAVEFARLGFQVVGVEVRDSNMAVCEYVKSRTNLPNLTFVQDDVWNIAKYGKFDAVFCCGLFYHLDKPKQFLETLAPVITKLLILQTHFATDTIYARMGLPFLIRRVLAKFMKNPADVYDSFNLSPVTKHEGVAGQWFKEFAADTPLRNRDTLKWAAWDNSRSFWIQREYLLQAIQDVGFDLVMEQFDGLQPTIVESMLRGYYRTDRRGTFIGIKTQA